MKHYNQTEKNFAITELKLIHLDMLNLTKGLDEKQPLSGLLESYESLKKRFDKIQETVQCLAEDSMQHRCNIELMNFEMLIGFITSGFKKMEDLIKYLGGEQELVIINREPQPRTLTQKLKQVFMRTA